MSQLVIPYSSEVLGALGHDEEEFEQNARLLLAIKLYEMGKLTTGLAAELAGVPRSSFIFLLKDYGLSPFGQDEDELEEDLSSARRASHRQ
jgi:predicted HTH domain antitoxin